MPQQIDKYRDVKDVSNQRKFILNYISDWALELFVLPLFSSLLSPQMHLILGYKDKHLKFQSSHTKSAYNQIYRD